LLLFLNAAQLLLYIGILALLGQGLLFILAGAKRDTNLFYQLFTIVNKPWTSIATLIAPKQIAKRHHPFVAFCVVAVLYLAVTVAKIEHCVSVGMASCK
jgi:carbon starvation protein CstA